MAEEDDGLVLNIFVDEKKNSANSAKLNNQDDSLKYEEDAKGTNIARNSKKERTSKEALTKNGGGNPIDHAEESHHKGKRNSQNHSRSRKFKDKKREADDEIFKFYETQTHPFSHPQTEQYENENENSEKMKTDSKNVPLKDFQTDSNIENQNESKSKNESHSKKRKDSEISNLTQNHSKNAKLAKISKISDSSTLSNPNPNPNPSSNPNSTFKSNFDSNFKSDEKTKAEINEGKNRIISTQIETKPTPKPTPKPVPKPVSVFSEQNFASLGLCEELVSHIHENMKLTLPTHVQQFAIPKILSGADVLVNSNTGSGKTFVYLFPIINKLINLKPKISRTDGAFALILAPTRELCLQIYQILLHFSKKFYFIVPGYVMGGENKSKEKARLRKGINILVASPGRLLDHLKNTKSFEFKFLNFVVFDEADRLLDLGFEKDIFEILEILEAKNQIQHHNANSANAETQKILDWNLGKRQNILLSATLNPRVQKLGSKSLTDPIIVNVSESKNLENGVLKGKNSKTNLEINLKKRKAGEDDDDDDEKSEGEEDVKEKEKDERGEGGEDDDSDFDFDMKKEVSKNSIFNIPNTITQFYLKVSCRMRLVSLFAFLKSKLIQNKSTSKMLLFVSTCDSVEFLHRIFSDFCIENFFSDRSKKFSVKKISEPENFLNCPIFKLHGSMKQKERAESFLAYGKSPRGILISTDVASRGLDFPAVDCIVQYDPPGEAEEYVHRVGRTARLGKEGESVIFLQPCEEGYLKELSSHGVIPQESKLITILNNIPIHKKKEKNGMKSFSELPENHFGAAALQMRIETFVDSRPDLNVLATDGFRSFLRGYGAYKGTMKQIFHPRKLHLGHVAKSYGLKNAPSVLGQSSVKKEIAFSKKQNAKNLKRKKMRNHPARELE